MPRARSAIATKNPSAYCQTNGNAAAKLLLWDNLQGSRAAEPVCILNGKGSSATDIYPSGSELMQSVLQRRNALLKAWLMKASLLTHKFWVQATYRVRSCFMPLVGFGPREQEQKRPPNGPVKILCLPYDGRAQQRHERRHESVLCFETLFGASCWVDSMFVWFPAAWMPLVVNAIRAKNVWWEGVGGHQGAVASTDALSGTARDFSFKFKKWQIDEDAKRVRSWMPGSMWIGSHWTQGSLLTSSLNYTMAYSMMFSHRKPPWVGTQLQPVVWLSASSFRAAWKLKIGCCLPDRKETCGLCRWPHTQWQVIYLRSNLCAENVDGWRHDTSGWHLIHSG